MGFFLAGADGCLEETLLSPLADPQTPLFQSKISGHFLESLSTEDGSVVEQFLFKWRERNHFQSYLKISGSYASDILSCFSTHWSLWLTSLGIILRAVVPQATLPSAALLVSDSCEGVAPQREQPPNIPSLPRDPFVVRKSAHMQIVYWLFGGRGEWPLWWHAEQLTVNNLDESFPQIAPHLHIQVAENFIFDDKWEGIPAPSSSFPLKWFQLGSSGLGRTFLLCQVNFHFRVRVLAAGYFLEGKIFFWFLFLPPHMGCAEFFLVIIWQLARLKKEPPSHLQPKTLP